AWNLRVPTALGPFPGSGGAERALAGVSSLSFGGTNVHLVVAEPPPPARAPDHDEEPAETAPYVLPLSAHSAPALRSRVGAMARVAGRGEPLRLLDLCYTAAVRRTPFDHRTAVVVRSRQELRGELTAFLARAGGDAQKPAAAAPRTAFLLPDPAGLTAVGR